ncbi:sugar kinase [Streptomyces sp. NPDC020801]|uniref:sugar kinase n=1 Tax=unclassified Streptomyces TaxID=2593676 RepID=UPI0037B82B82
MPDSELPVSISRTAAPPEVVLCGEAMLLLVAQPGVPLERAVAFRRSVAGAESNVAIALARLGHRARWLSRLGADSAGRAVLAQIRGEGVDVSYVTTDVHTPTGLLLRDSHACHPLDVQYYRAGSAACRLAPESLTPDMVAGAQFVHVTGITAMLSDTALAATERLVELAWDVGAQVSFDPNVRLKLAAAEHWRRIAGPLMRRADLVLAGEDELDLFADGSGGGYQRLVDELLAGGVGAVVVKHRDKSASYFTAAGVWGPHPPLQVPITDPVGAGDAFAAGFLSALLRKAPPEQALEEASAVAALTIQCVTDTDGLPSRAVLDRALAAYTQGRDTVAR